MAAVLFVLLLVAITVLLSIVFSNHELPSGLVRWLRPLGLLAIIGIIYLKLRVEPGGIAQLFQQQYGEKTGRRVIIGLLVLFVVGWFALLVFRAANYRALNDALRAGTLER